MTFSAPPEGASSTTAVATEIADDNELIRGITEEQVIYDERRKCRRVSSAAIDTSSEPNGGMSMDLRRLVEAAGISPEEHIEGRWVGALLLTAGMLRAEGLRVGHDPLPTNPYHCQAWGKITKGMQRKILRSARWYVPVGGVNISDQECDEANQAHQPD